MGEARARILLVEDEPDIAEFVQTELEVEGYAVRLETDGMRGLVAARQDGPDLIILDRLLPQLDGLGFLKRLRQHSDVPVIMLTALGQLPDRLEGLRAGATDYLPKPFDIEELLARVEAQLRLARPAPRTVLSFGTLSLDVASREVSYDGAPVDLTPKEYDLLHDLLQHPRQVRPRAQLLEAVWGYDFGGEDNVLEVTISNLRAKLERGGRARVIQTVRGVGYMLKEAA